MPHVLIVNPSERPAKRKARNTARKTSTKKEAPVAKKQRTAAQKAATRRMIAANRARKAPKRPARKVSRAKPAARRTTSKPRRAKRSRPITSAVVATRAGRQLRYRRKNPISGFGSFVTGTLMPSAVGGAGALALDVLLGVLPLPAAVKTGPMAPVAKIAGAVGLGYVAGMVVSRRTAEQIAAGALTVTFYNLAKQLLIKVGGGRIPGLADYDVGMYPDGVGAYVSGDMPDAIGYPGNAQQVGDLVPDGMGGYETGVYR